MRLLFFTYKESLPLVGHETLCVSHKTPNLVQTIKDFKPDLLIEEEKNDGLAIYTNVYKELTTPRAYWVIDAHITLAEHINYAKQFDYVFCAQSWFVPHFQRETRARVYYLPLCHTQTIEEYLKMLETPVERDIEFSFIGNIRSLHVERERFVHDFLKKLGNRFFARQSDYNKTLEYLRRSKLTFNCSLNNDLNFRVWEALACGAGIVTDHVTDTNNVKGLKYYLTLYDKMYPDFSAVERPVFTYGSEDFIKNGHTMTHRMNQLVHMVETDTQYGY